MPEKKIVRTALDPTPLRVNPNMPDYDKDPYFIKCYEDALKLVKETKVLEHIEEMNSKK